MSHRAPGDPALHRHHEHDADAAALAALGYHSEFKRDMSRDEALRVAIEALIDAADEDLGTGAPDLQRGIVPSVKTITRSGFADVADDEIRRHCEAVLNDRNRL